MARSDSEFVAFKNWQKILGEDHTPEILLASLYESIFGKHHPPRAHKELEVNGWGSSQIARAVQVVAQVIARYVQLFYEPKNLPVTSYWKQKQVTLALDSHFSALFWEALKRSGKHQGGYKVYDELEKDEFLDKPILSLKQEARQKRFTLIKTESGRMAIAERVVEKLVLSGVHLEHLAEEDFHSLE